MSLGGNKSKSSSSSTMNQSQTTSLGQEGLDYIRGNIDRLRNTQYEGVNPNSIVDFQNPYLEQVINNSMADINRQQQTALAQGGDAAYAAGAFGGSRHGVADAVTRSEYDRNAASTAANLRSEGYNNALAAAFQDANMRNQYEMAMRQLEGNYGSLLAQHGSTTNTTGTQTGKNSSSNFGFGWTAKG